MTAPYERCSASRAASPIVHLVVSILFLLSALPKHEATASEC